jgi:GTPase SAR1 family protein
VRPVDDLPTFKILVMGERACGKSALFARLLGKSFTGMEHKEDTTVNMGVRIFENVEKTPAGTLEVMMMMMMMMMRMRMWRRPPLGRLR